MATKKKLLQAAAGSAGGGALNVEEVFSTYLYTGNSSTQTITNDIDLDGEGGLVWLKSREDTKSHFLYDTERGASSGHLTTNATYAQYGVASGLSAFNSNGFSLAAWNDMNGSGIDFASWTFRKAPKFFDVVTYTGNGVAGRTVSHNLGSVPGFIVVKRTNNTGSWAGYHRSIGNTAAIQLNYTNAIDTYVGYWNNTSPTSTEFTLGSFAEVNGNGDTFVAYLFAHNDGDGEFGPTGDQDIIKCGSYNGSSTDFEVDLGWEPQWLMIKKSAGDYASGWAIFDNMRGVTTGGSENTLLANSSVNENGSGIGSNNFVDFTSTGFALTTNFSLTNDDFTDFGGQYIYIAIRRGPMAVPTAATDVFAVQDGRAAESVNGNSWTSGFPIDAFLQGWKTGGTNHYLSSRITDGEMPTNSTSAETGATFNFDDMDGLYLNRSGSANSSPVGYMWKRAPNYFDVVAYTGNGTAGRTVSHNLGVAPEMMWFKARNGERAWRVWHSSFSNGSVRLNSSAAKDTSTNYFSTPTADNIVLGSDNDTNSSLYNYIAYLFASVDGVSKVGTFTLSGSSYVDVDCGFSSGARFVLVKCYSTISSWELYDTERGITSGNDPMLALDSTAAESSGPNINPLSSGFSINAANFNAGDYIFYAIA